ncbi:MAG: tetratricopeptide repeat protein, partial [Myxococcales bacterium]|nr:tetratricopeptide repeat protein [Myxococcales bacterium]
LAIEPDSATRWTNLGAARSAAGRYAEAAEATREALRRAPGDRTARLNLARYLLHLGDAAGALAEVERLLAHTPDADALALRGVLRGNAGDLAGARADFEAAVALEPNQPEATMGLRRLQAMPGPR